MSKTIDWCCARFAEYYSVDDDERGLAVTGYGSLAPTGFGFVCRSIARRHEPQLQAASLPIPISMTMTIRIRHCPWCGRGLVAHYGSQRYLPRRDSEAD